MYDLLTEKLLGTAEVFGEAGYTHKIGRCSLIYKALMKPDLVRREISLAIHTPCHQASITFAR